jgi:hypothetical protein
MKKRDEWEHYYYLKVFRGIILCRPLKVSQQFIGIPVDFQQTTWHYIL